MLPDSSLTSTKNQLNNIVPSDAVRCWFLIDVDGHSRIGTYSAGFNATFRAYRTPMGALQHRHGNILEIRHIWGNLKELWGEVAGDRCYTELTIAVTLVVWQFYIYCLESQLSTAKSLKTRLSVSSARRIDVLRTMLAGKEASRTVGTDDLKDAIAFARASFPHPQSGDNERYNAVLEAMLNAAIAEVAE